MEFERLSCSSGGVDNPDSSSNVGFKTPDEPRLTSVNTEKQEPGRQVQEYELNNREFPAPFRAFHSFFNFSPLKENLDVYNDNLAQKKAGKAKVGIKDRATLANRNQNAKFKENNSYCSLNINNKSKKIRKLSNLSIGKGQASTDCRDGANSHAHPRSHHNITVAAGFKKAFLVESIISSVSFPSSEVILPDSITESGFLTSLQQKNNLSLEKHEYLKVRKPKARYCSTLCFLEKDKMLTFYCFDDEDIFPAEIAIKRAKNTQDNGNETDDEQIDANVKELYLSLRFACEGIMI